MITAVANDRNNRPASCPLTVGLITLKQQFALPTTFTFATIRSRPSQMKPLKKQHLATWTLATALSTATAIAAEPQLERFEFTQVQMGVDFKLTFYAADRGAANRAADEAFARVAELNRSMSDYDRDSELMRLCRTSGNGESVAVSSDLWYVLARSQALARESEGVFDVTVGPVVRLWRRARPRAARCPAPRAWRPPDRWSAIG